MRTTTVRFDEETWVDVNPAEALPLLGDDGSALLVWHARERNAPRGVLPTLIATEWYPHEVPAPPKHTPQLTPQNNRSPA